VVNNPLVDLTPVFAALAGLGALWVALIVVFWLLRPRDVPMRMLVGIVPDLVRTLRALVTDGSAPFDVRAVLVGLLVWIISPIDLIPEFIPVLGPFDDLVVAVVALRYVRRRLGVDEMRRRWVGSPEGFALLTRVMGTG
jgi:uncharacterized membrane protein YkvA (DUF1232 family)